MTSMDKGKTSAEPSVSSGQPTESSGLRSANSPRTSSLTGGIFDGGFEAYRTVTQEDYRGVLTSGLVVLDTNALLNLYKYHSKTRNELLDLLTSLGDRLWIPHQVMFEFWERRAGVIEDKAKELAEAIQELEKYRRQFEERIRSWANRIGLSPEQATGVAEIIAPAVDAVTEGMRKLGTDDALENAQDDTAQDPVVTAISAILERNVALSPSTEELQEARRVAEERYSQERPPGWRDHKKRKNPEGDYLIWRETLQESKRRGVDVLLVTGDVKDDWWRKERGQVKGPLPELAQEMREIADVRLFMLRPDSFLLHAGQVLEGLNVSNESVEDAQRVSVLSAEGAGEIYQQRLALAMMQLGYNVIAFDKDFGYEIKVGDSKDRVVLVRLQINQNSKGALRSSHRVLKLLRPLPVSSLIPRLLVSNTPIPAADLEAYNEAEGMGAVVWRDEHDNGELDFALQRLLETVPPIEDAGEAR